jgi:hypothetical protein
MSILCIGPMYDNCRAVAGNPGFLQGMTLAQMGLAFVIVDLSHCWVSLGLVLSYFSESHLVESALVSHATAT